MPQEYPTSVVLDGIVNVCDAMLEKINDWNDDWEEPSPKRVTIINWERMLAMKPFYLLC